MRNEMNVTTNTTPKATVTELKERVVRISFLNHEICVLDNIQNLAKWRGSPGL
jgi:hypothetical protein